MPVHLPQLSRREFLKRAALAGVGLGLGELVPRNCSADLFGKSRDQHTFFFLSDSHVAAEAAFINKGVNVTDNLAACVRELAAWPVKPAAVIVNGDLAFKSGEPGDYATFGKTIESVRALASLHVTLGNHDERKNFWQAFPHDVAELKAVPQKQAAVFSSSRANWFVLDSLEVTDVPDGSVGAAQFSWLDAELAARPDKPAIIVCHHNLKLAGMSTGLKDTSEMEELFAKHKQVKAFVFGHTHNWNVSRHFSGVHLINLPPTGYVFKEGRPSGWVCCTLAKDGAEFELRALDAKHPEHGQKQKLKWRVA